MSIIGRDQLTDELIGTLGNTRQETRARLNMVLENIIGHLVRGEAVTLRGLGRFTPYVKPAHRGRNPKTGEKVDVPPLKKCRYKMSDWLRSEMENTKWEGKK